MAKSKRPTKAKPPNDVAQFIRHLCRKGLLTREEFAARTLVPTVEFIPAATMFPEPTK
jgi:hypothetical protein